MRKLICHLLILLSPVAVFCQSNTAMDSLILNLAKAKQDSTRAKILNTIVETEPNPEIWSRYNQELLLLCEKNLKKSGLTQKEKTFFKKHLADSYNNQGMFFAESGHNKEAFTWYQKSIDTKKEIGDTLGLAIAIYNLGFSKQNIGLISEALRDFENALILFVAIKQAQNSAQVLNDIATLNQGLGNSQKAERIFLKSIQIFQLANDQHGVAGGYNNLGHLYYAMGNIREAILFFNKSLKVMETLGDEDGIANALNNLALIYKAQGDLDKALGILIKSKSHSELGRNKRTLASIINNIAGIYQDRKQYKEALIEHRKALQVRINAEDQNGLPTSLINIGVIYKYTHQFDSAFYYYKLAHKIATETGNKSLQCNALVDMAWLHYENKNFKQAILLGKQGYALSQEIGYPTDIRMAAYMLSQAYKQTENYADALRFFETHIRMRDSINNDEIKKASIKQELKYEYEKKAAADSVKVAEEKKVTVAKLKQEKTQRYALYGGLSLVFVFALFMVNRFRITNQQKKLIESQKKIVEQQKSLVEEKQKEILDSIHYARRIQSALVTSDYYIEKTLKRLKN